MCNKKVWPDPIMQGLRHKRAPLVHDVRGHLEVGGGDVSWPPTCVAWAARCSRDGTCTFVWVGKARKCQSIKGYSCDNLLRSTSYINFDAHNYHFLLQLPKPVFISPHDPQLPDLQETAAAIQENSYFVQGPPQAQASLVHPVQARIRRDPTAFHESLATTPPGILSNRSSTSPQFPLTKAPFVHPIDVQFHNLSVGTASAQRTPAPRLPSSQRCNPHGFHDGHRLAKHHDR